MTHNARGLLPCPFCGEAEDIDEYWEIHGVLRFVRCNGCGVRKSYTTAEQARALWNTRNGVEYAPH